MTPLFVSNLFKIVNFSLDIFYGILLLISSRIAQTQNRELIFVLVLLIL